MELDEPKAYGRLVTDDEGRFTQIVEARIVPLPNWPYAKSMPGSTGRMRAYSSVCSAVWTKTMPRENSISQIWSRVPSTEGSVTKVVLRGDEAGYAFGVNDRRDLAAAEAAMQTRLRAEACRPGSLSLTLTE